MKQTGPLVHLTTLGGLLGIKTQALLPRLAAVPCDDLTVIVPHGFDTLAVSCAADRTTARAVCGSWLEALAGDELHLEIGAAHVVAWSDEAALPEHAPAAVRAVADDVAAIGHDGTAWTYAIEHANTDEEAVDAALSRIHAFAAERGVSISQRRVADDLYRSLARGMASRVLVGERTLALAWDRVEWRPLQSMLRGFHPRGRGVDLVARLARAVDTQHATVELSLGPIDPPALRFAFPLSSAS